MGPASATATRHCVLSSADEPLCLLCPLAGVRPGMTHLAATGGGGLHTLRPLTTSVMSAPTENSARRRARASPGHSVHTCCPSHPTHQPTLVAFTVTLLTFPRTVTCRYNLLSPPSFLRMVNVRRSVMSHFDETYDVMTGRATQENGVVVVGDVVSIGVITSSAYTLSRWW